jgi:hypothetical protein
MCLKYIKIKEIAKNICSNIHCVYNEEVLDSDVVLVITLFSEVIVLALAEKFRISNGLGYFSVKLNTRKATITNNPNYLNYGINFSFKRSIKLRLRKLNPTKPS